MADTNNEENQKTPESPETEDPRNAAIATMTAALLKGTSILTTMTEQIKVIKNMVAEMEQLESPIAVVVKALEITDVFVASGEPMKDMTPLFIDFEAALNVFPPEERQGQLDRVADILQGMYVLMPITVYALYTEYQKSVSLMKSITEPLLEESKSLKAKTDAVNKAYLALGMARFEAESPLQLEFIDQAKVVTDLAAAVLEKERAEARKKNHFDELEILGDALRARTPAYLARESERIAALPEGPAKQRELAALDAALALVTPPED